MFELAAKIILFVLVISVLIGFHEFGHFWMARRLGVMVERFSIGFGKVIFSRTSRSGVEFCISAVPLGGYVKMLEAQGNDLSAKAKLKAFDCQKTWRKLLIVLAGPAFNFLLAALFFSAVYLIGIQDFRAKIAAPSLGSAAYNAKLQAGDQIISIDDNVVHSWADVNFFLLKSSSAIGRNQHIHVVVARDGAAELSVHLPNTELLKSSQGAAAQLGLNLGLEFGTEIADVSMGSAASHAGIKAGDKIISIDHQRINSWQQLLSTISAAANRQVQIGILRQGNLLDLTVDIGKSINQFGVEIGLLGVAPKIDQAQLARQQLKVRYAPLRALELGIAKTYQSSLFMLQVVYRLITGGASWRSVNGPLGIADHASKAVQAGFVYLLSLMAAISVSLGVMNLLPIPVLDGGHVMYYLVEAIKGKPLSARTMLLTQNLGLLLLCAFMAVAFYNDLQALAL